MRVLFLNKLALFILLFSVTGCQYLKNGAEEGEEKPLARMNEKYLYYSDIKDIVKNTHSPSDSAEVISRYVDDWIKRNLILEKAKAYLPAEKQDVEKQVNDYRESLIVHIYEKELVMQKLDTSVTTEKMRTFYKENKDNFDLRHDILQFYYIKLPRVAPKIDSVKYWIGSSQQSHKIKLADYCFQYAEDFSISDTAWYKLDMVYRQIPAEQQDLDRLIQNRRPGVVEDSINTYVLKVNDQKQKGELAPLNYVIPDVKKMILNKRKLELIQDTYESIYQDGIRKNNFEVY